VEIWVIAGDRLSEIICSLHEQSGVFSALALIRAMDKKYLSGEHCFCNRSTDPDSIIPAIPNQSPYLLTL
jgi:hypothetical protein